MEFTHLLDGDGEELFLGVIEIALRFLAEHLEVVDDVARFFEIDRGLSFGGVCYFAKEHDAGLGLVVDEGGKACVGGFEFRFAHEVMLEKCGLMLKGRR